jgi:acyl-CoA thioester hydrolase
MSTHSFPVRIYYEDTDFSGYVYHAAYLKFFERGRTEFLRDLGIHHFELIEQGIAFAVRKMEIDFVGAARIDDLLAVETKVIEASAVRLVLEQTVLTTARVLVVAIKTTGGPVRLPAALRARLTGES